MIADIIIKRPEPFVFEQPLRVFNSATNVKQTITTLQAGKPVLITAFYSNGLLLLRALKKHLKTILPNTSFHEQREFRAEYHKLSNLVLIEIANHELTVKKSPVIGWLIKLYPETSHFFLSFVQI